MSKKTEIMSIINAYSGHSNTIAIPRIYIDLTGDYASAALLSQIIYWCDRTKDPDGWFYKSYADWQDELGLSEYQVKRAIKGDKRRKKAGTSLEALGVETTLRQNPQGAPTLHYRIDEAVLVGAIISHIQQSTVSIPNNVQNGNQTMSGMDTQQSSECIEETTTETTTETKNSTAQALAPTETPQGTSSEKVETPSKAQRDEWYDTIRDVFDLHKARNVNLGKMLQGNATDSHHKPYNLDEPMTPEQVKQWGAWYRKTELNGDSKLTMVKSPQKIQSSIAKWREVKLQPVIDNRLQARKLPANIAMLNTGKASA